MSGDPARFQRYEDLGTACSSPTRATRARHERLAVPGRRRQRRLARSAVLRHATSGPARSSSPGSGIRFRSSTASTPERRTRPRPARARSSSTTPCSARSRTARPISTRTCRSPPSSICASVGTSARVTATATPTRQIDVKAAFTTTRHTGELPWGASFGFSNDVEVALPYDSRTNDFTVGAEWTNSRSMLRVAYDGSWFNNLDDTLVWDSPLRLDDSTSAPGRGRMALWPSNSAQTISAAATRSSRDARRSPGSCRTASGATTSRCSRSRSTRRCRSSRCRGRRREAEAHVFSTNLNLVSRPATDWRFSARLRRYDYDNQTPQTAIPQFINYDTSVKTSSTGGPELYAHSRTTFDADATWTGLLPLALTAGYTHNSSGYDFRIFESTGEDVLTLKADAVGSQWVTFRAHYELADRTGSGLDEALLIADRRAAGAAPLRHRQPDAQSLHRPGRRHAERGLDRSARRSASARTTTTTATSACRSRRSASSRWRRTSSSRTASARAASYNYERYAGLQQSRSASPGRRRTR